MYLKWASHFWLSSQKTIFPSRVRQIPPPPPRVDKHIPDLDPSQSRHMAFGKSQIFQVPLTACKQRFWGCVGPMTLATCAKQPLCGSQWVLESPQCQQMKT